MRTQRWLMGLGSCVVRMFSDVERKVNFHVSPNNDPISQMMLWSVVWAVLCVLILKALLWRCDENPVTQCPSVDVMPTLRSHVCCSNDYIETLSPLCSMIQAFLFVPVLLLHNWVKTNLFSSDWCFFNFKLNCAIVFLIDVWMCPDRVLCQVVKWFWPGLNLHLIGNFMSLCGISSIY